MRSLRILCALILAVSLAVLPVSATFAVTHAGNTEAGMMAPGDDCPCCKPMKADSCALKCCHAPAVAADSLEMEEPPSLRFLVLGAEPFPANALGPDPPPPRT